MLVKVSLFRYIDTCIHVDGLTGRQMDRWTDRLTDVERDVCIHAYIHHFQVELYTYYLFLVRSDAVKSSFIPSLLTH